MSRSRTFTLAVLVCLLIAPIGMVPAARGAQTETGQITLEALYSADRSARTDYDGSTAMIWFWS